MRTVNGNKRAKNYFDLWQKSRITNLCGNKDYCAYTSASDAKWEAFDDCIARMYDLDGFNGRIITHSVFKFTFGFEYQTDKGIYFYLITPDKEERFEIVEEF